jgi:outer membrane protein, multidrug efflux system
MKPTKALLDQARKTIRRGGFETRPTIRASGVPSRISGLGLLLMLSLSMACAMGPNYKRPAIATPDAFRDTAPPATPESLADRSWWDLFPDPNLLPLIDEALASGYDARIAAARVEEYRARAGIARSQLFPQVDAVGEWQRGRQSDFVYPYGDKGVGEAYAAQATLYWELDIWGRLRRLNEAGRAQYLATEEARRGVMLSLVADVAGGYFELCELDQELDIAKNSTAAYQETYDLFNRRLEGGAASALMTSSAMGALGSSAAGIPRLEAEIQSKENALCLLLGRPPGPIVRSKLPSTADLPLDIPSGLPSALLERRPDVLQAEEDLVAFNANVGASKAAMFPTLSLTGLFGGVSPEVDTLFTRGKSWSVSPGLFQPLFHGGALWNQYQASKAQFEEARAAYEKAVTAAFAETSSALITHKKLVDVEAQQARSVVGYREAVRLANVRFLSGLSSYFEVLQNMQYLYPAELALSRVQLQRLTNYVNLYKALGGGWQNPGQARPSTEQTTNKTTGGMVPLK